ncbi:MAG: hypothetical protein E7369_02450 [Clostridiales bacterium]|nr:hypothetical protein [Clostridiales bacterium]
MKRFLVLILSIVMALSAFSFVGCNGDTPPNGNGGQEQGGEVENGGGNNNGGGVETPEVPVK